MLDVILKKLTPVAHPDLMVGMNTADDAGVFRISEDVALIQTVDFFTPIVDDPQAYGQIAAANSLSDVYAMGGRPITALNICGFPSDDVEPEVIAEVLRGAQEKVAESGAVLVGGHSVEDVEPKFGLSVTGVVHPDDVKTNAGARVGDRLILTKPLGTGLMSDAYQNGEIDEDALQIAVDSMVQLNRIAAEEMVAYQSAWVYGYYWIWVAGAWVGDGAGEWGGDFAFVLLMCRVLIWLCRLQRGARAVVCGAIGRREGMR